ncbi:MAG: hypothetical protein J6S49_02030 [Erysipelotrichaceae bacterium]|nr:hypothetical protein [Erysipelotrichaceae bacterium]
MPVSPMYGGGGNGGGFGGFGGDWGWIVLLLLLAGGGWGGGFGGGFGGGAANYDFPWLLTGQQNINTNTNNGFRDAMINDNITSVRDGISSLSTQLCGCCGDMQMALANGFAGVEIGANARQMADMQQMFNIQSSLQNCCCENRSNIADLKYTVATENCADRQTINEGVRDIIANQTAGTQRILDQLCADKIDSKNEKIAELQNQLNMATLRESQTAQNAFISQGFANEVDQLYNRLSNCPVPTTPVYGRTPIFTCNNNGCGCGCGNF